MKLSQLLLIALIAISLFSSSVLSQNQSPLGIRPQSPEGKGVVALKAARLIDGTGAAPINNAVIIVTDNKITAVGDVASVRVPSGAKIIDLGNVTLMPGFIDAPYASDWPRAWRSRQRHGFGQRL